MTSFYSSLHEKLVIQKLCRESHKSVMVHRFHKRKSCCHVIAIPQAGIAAPTLTVMQGFQAKKKRLLGAFPFPLLHTASVLRILPFCMFVTQARIKPGCNGWKANALTTRPTLRSFRQCSYKMSNI